MTDAQHTPLPWRTNTIIEGRAIAIEAGRNTHICQVAKDALLSHDETNANAAFIVRACNSHYELLGALKDIRSRFASCIAQGNGEIAGDKEALARADSAIAKAEGK